LSGIGLCDELITRPEESYRLWSVVVCDLETAKIPVNEEAKAHQGAIAPRENYYYYYYYYYYINEELNDMYSSPNIVRVIK
jgi:hypothetical protein